MTETIKEQTGCDNNGFPNHRYSFVLVTSVIRTGATGVFGPGSKDGEAYFKE